MYPQLDPKYKHIVPYNYENGWTAATDWVNEYSTGSVSVAFDYSKANPAVIYFGFENIDDATVFKIKFSI